MGLVQSCSLPLIGPHPEGAPQTLAADQSPPRCTGNPISAKTAAGLRNMSSPEEQLCGGRQPPLLPSFPWGLKWHSWPLSSPRELSDGEVWGGSNWALSPSWGPQVWRQVCSPMPKEACSTCTACGFLFLGWSVSKVACLWTQVHSLKPNFHSIKLPSFSNVCLLCCISQLAPKFTRRKGGIILLSEAFVTFGREPPFSLGGFLGWGKERVT